MSFPKLSIVAVVTSALAHVGAYLSIASAPGRSCLHQPTTTASFAILPAAPAPPEPASAPTEAEPPDPTPPNRPTPRPKDVPAAPRPPEPGAPAEPSRAAPAADLTGITLTNAAGTGWLSAVGDGSSRAGPLRNVQVARAATSATTPSASRPRRFTSAPAPAAVTVAPEDLSKPPRAPDLDGALESNYPPEARAAGLSGGAVIRALISATGEARPLAILSESSPGFGAACLRTLAGSRWSAPVDRAGRTVATEVRYRCTFKVAR